MKAELILFREGLECRENLAGGSLKNGRFAALSLAHRSPLKNPGWPADAEGVDSATPAGREGATLGRRG